MTNKPRESSTQTVEDTIQTYQADQDFSFIKKAIVDANLLVKANKVDAAVEKWQAIANIVEGNNEKLAEHAWENLGNLLYKQERTEEALYAYNNAIRLNSKNAETHVHRGKVKNILELYEDAIEDCNEAINLNTSTTFVKAAAYTTRGVAKFGLGDYVGAFADHDAALRLDPKCADAFFNIGIAKMKQGEDECAIAEFDKAIDICPDMAEAYHYRGYVKFFLGQLKAAVSDYDQAICLAPWQGASYTNRGLVKYALGRHEAAFADYEEAIRVDPTFAHGYTYRAEMKIRQNRDAEARADLETALKLARAADDQIHQTYVETSIKELDESEENNS